MPSLYKSSGSCKKVFRNEDQEEVIVETGKYNNAVLYSIQMRKNDFTYGTQSTVNDLLRSLKSTKRIQEQLFSMDDFETKITRRKRTCPYQLRSEHRINRVSYTLGRRSDKNNLSNVRRIASVGLKKCPLDPNPYTTDLFHDDY